MTFTRSGETRSTRTPSGTRTSTGTDCVPSPRPSAFAVATTSVTCSRFSTGCGPETVTWTTPGTATAVRPSGTFCTTTATSRTCWPGMAWTPTRTVAVCSPMMVMPSGRCRGTTRTTSASAPETSTGAVLIDCVCSSRAGSPTICTAGGSTEIRPVQ